MADLAKLRTHTDAIVALLEAAALDVFDGGWPDAPDEYGWEGTPGQSRFAPYVIVNPVPGGERDGPLGCPDDDYSGTWIVHSIAETRERCQWLADQVSELLIGATLTVADRYISRLHEDLDGGVQREDQIQPPLYISSPRYRVQSSPAS